MSHLKIWGGGKKIHLAQLIFDPLFWLAVQFAFLCHCLTPIWTDSDATEG